MAGGAETAESCSERSDKLTGGKPEKLKPEKLKLGGVGGRLIPAGDIPDGTLDLLTPMHRNGASGPDHRGFPCHVNQGTINQGGERQTVRRVEDNVMMAGILSRLLLGSSNDIAALLLVVGHHVVRGENHGRMPGGILLVNADKYDVPAANFHPRKLS